MGRLEVCVALILRNIQDSNPQKSENILTWVADFRIKRPADHSRASKTFQEGVLEKKVVVYSCHVKRFCLWKWASDKDEIPF